MLPDGKSEVNGAGVLLRSLCIVSLFLLGISPLSAQDRLVNQLQRELILVGLDPGPVDGLWGQRTAQAAGMLGVAGRVERPRDVSRAHKSALLQALNAQWEEREKDQAHLQRIMTLSDARHLLERVGIGAHPAEIESLLGLTRSQAISRMMVQLDVSHPVLPAPRWINGPYVKYFLRRDYEADERQRFEAARDMEMGAFRLWWVREMLSTDRAAGERLLLIWHNLFVTQYSTLEQEPLSLAKQHNMLRTHGTGNLRLILQELVRDAAMLNYLDNRNNTAKGPNENLAREFMELFVLGEGNYTEQDVKEVARAFSGYRYNALRNFEFRFADWDHDKGTKHILGRRGRFGADDVIDILLDQPAAAEHVTRHFWKAYVSEFNDTPSERAQIADTFRESDYDIKTLMRALWATPAFWAEDNRGSIVKSPVDLVLGTMRTAGVLPDWWQAAPSRMRGMGQHLFEAPNVAGWPGGAAWITPARIQERTAILSEFDTSPAYTLGMGQSSGNMMMSMMTEQEQRPTSVTIRYAAEDFEGPAQFRVVGMKEIDGHLRTIWQSKAVEAQNGWNTERYGRVSSPADLNWQTVQLPFSDEDALPDIFRISFLNDHCCGPGGSGGGDRNLFVDWLQVGGRLYPAKDGAQLTCRDGADLAGQMYCSGTLTLTSYQGPAEDEPDARLQTAGLVVERAALDWVSHGSADFISFGLAEVRFEDIHINAMSIELQRERYDGREEYALKIYGRQCYPDCFPDGWPARARSGDDGHFRIGLPLSFRQDHRAEAQYHGLTERQKRFVGALWAAVPALYEVAQNGQNWRRRADKDTEIHWDPVMEHIAQTIPRTRYKLAEGQPELTLSAYRAEAGAMGMMMANAASQDIRLLSGIASEVNWLATRPELLHQDAGDRFVANARDVQSWESFGHLIRDPRFQLK